MAHCFKITAVCFTQFGTPRQHKQCSLSSYINGHSKLTLKDPQLKTQTLHNQSSLKTTKENIFVVDIGFTDADNLDLGCRICVQGDRNLAKAGSDKVIGWTTTPT